MLGDRIKEARKAKKLTQKELADIIGVRNSSISDWENNLHSPNVEQVKQLCEALNVDPNRLYGESEARLLRETPFTEYITENGDELPEDAKKELNNFIEYLKVKYKKQ